MLKQLTAAVLILAFTASTFCRTVIVLDYYANTTAYAKDCINKARKEMHCNGKCQMMKKLDQQEKDDQDNLERKAENKNEVQPANAFCKMPVGIKIITLHVSTHFIVKATVDRSYSLLRPPSIG
ncbi:MAG: hypothetical protein QM726_02665 [Chitinophagaceae bacterium]